MKERWQLRWKSKYKVERMEEVRKRTNWDIKWAQRITTDFPPVLCWTEDPTQGLHVGLLYNIQESTLSLMRMFSVVLCDTCKAAGFLSYPVCSSMSFIFFFKQMDYTCSLLNPCKNLQNMVPSLLLTKSNLTCIDLAIQAAQIWILQLLIVL